MIKQGKALGYDTVSSQLKLAVDFCVTFWPVNASLACAPCRSITPKYQLAHTKMLLRTRLFWKEYQWMTQELIISWSVLFPQTTNAAKIQILDEYQVNVIISTNILNNWFWLVTATNETPDCLQRWDSLQCWFRDCHEANSSPVDNQWSTFQPSRDFSRNHIFFQR